MPNLTILFAIYTVFFLFVLGILGPLESRLEDFYGGPQNAGQNKISASKYFSHCKWSLHRGHSYKWNKRRSVLLNEICFTRLFCEIKWLFSLPVSYNWNSLERKLSFSNECLLCIVPPKLLGTIMGRYVKLSVAPFNRVSVTVWWL